jgi:hypothetical protein
VLLVGLLAAVAVGAVWAGAAGDLIVRTRVAERALRR